MNTDRLQIESSLLGVYMRYPHAFEEAGVAHLTNESLFSDGIFQMLFKLIQKNHFENVIPDLVVLSTQAAALGYNKNDVLKKMSTVVTNGAKMFSIKEYVGILFDENARTTILPLLYQAHLDINSGFGVMDSLTSIKSTLNNIDNIYNNVRQERSFIDVANEIINTEYNGDEDSVTGIPSGIKTFDKVTNGFPLGITVIGARPGMGKTSFIVNSAVNHFHVRKKPVKIFSLEMPIKELMINIIGNILDIDTKLIRRNRLNHVDKQRVYDLCLLIETEKLLSIDDTPGITWQYIDASIGKSRRYFGLDIEMEVYIDYLQLMTNTPDEDKGTTMDTKLSYRCNNLANSAKKHNVAMIELSQLTREVEKRNPPRPILSDLKESGSIEANAILVVLLYRPDYYTPNPVDKERGISLKGLCMGIIAKNRYGELDNVYMIFMPKFSKFLPYYDNGIEQTTLSIQENSDIVTNTNTIDF